MTFFEPQEPELHWDEYRLQVLCCLFRFFHEDKAAFEQIFSEFFRDHLCERGFSEGVIAYRVLYGQWSGMKQTNYDVWRFVHMETEFNVNGEWKHTIQTIIAVANRLGIVL